MSAIGLPMNGHVAEHFAPDGLCQCPCDQCTTRGAMFCVCLQCPCEEQAEHDRGDLGDECDGTP